MKLFINIIHVLIEIGWITSVWSVIKRFFKAPPSPVHFKFQVPNSWIPGWQSNLWGLHNYPDFSKLKCDKLKLIYIFQIADIFSIYLNPSCLCLSSNMWIGEPKGLIKFIFVKRCVQRKRALEVSWQQKISKNGYFFLIIFGQLIEDPQINCLLYFYFWGHLG